MEKTTIKETKPFEYLVERRYKSYTTIIKAAIIASLTMFLMLMFFFTVYFFQTKAEGLALPKLFFLSTGIILFSSYFLQETKHAFLKDNIEEVKKNALITLLFGIGFLLCQIIAWWMMLEGLNHEKSANVSIKILVYFMAFLHFLHAFAGIVFWSIFTFQMHERLIDFHISPVYFTDPIVKSKLMLFTLFWHFVDILWLVLFLFFLFFQYFAI